MARFACIAERCEWNCCREWRVPVDPIHAEIFLGMKEADGTNPFAGFLKKIKSTRGGKAETAYYFDLPGTEDRRCRFLNENRRCKIQERYGEAGLSDTCLLFPRRLIQIDRETLMTVSLACPETIRRLILTDERLRLTTVGCAPDPDADWLDSEQIPDPALRGLIRNRGALLADWFGLIYDDRRPFSSRLHRLYEAIARCDPTRKPSGRIRPAPAEIGETILRIEESFNPKPDGFRSRVSNSVAELFGGRDYLSLIGKAFEWTDREILTPFFASHPRWLENYAALALYSDALTEFNAFLRPEASLSGTVRFTLARLVLALNLLTLRLAAAAGNEGEIRVETFMRVVHDIDRNFYQSPSAVEAVVERLARKRADRPVAWLSGYLSGRIE